MGDLRFAPYYGEIRDAPDRAAVIRSLTDEEVIAALAEASRHNDPYLANVLATEAQNRVHEKEKIISTAAEGVYALDREGRVTFMNEAAGRLLGWGPDELLGECIHDTIHHRRPDGADFPREGCPIQGVLRSGKAARVGGDMFVRSDGRLVPVAYAAAPVVRDGEVEGVVVVFRDVTEHKLAEAEASRRNARLRVMYETAHDLLLADEPREALGRIFSRLSRHLGLEVYFNFLLAEDSEALCLDSYAGVPEATAATFTRLELGQAVCGCVDRDQSPIVVEGVQSSADPRASLIRDLGIRAYACFPLIARGRLVGTLSFGTRARDALPPEDLEFLKAVSEQVALALDRRRNEARLRNSEEDYRNLFDSVPDAIVVANMDWGVVACNAPFTSLTGYTLADLQGGTAELLYATQAEYEAVGAALRESAQETRFTQLTRWRKKTDEGFPAEITASYLRDKAGNVEGFIGVVKDVTERQCAEAEVRRIRDHLESIVNSVGGIVWEGDPKTYQFTFVSQEAERILGYPLQHWIEEPTFWMQHIHPEDRERVMHFCLDATAAGRDHAFEYRMITADGDVVWLRDIVTLRLEKGRPTKSFGVMVDITDLKRAQEELQNHRDRLTELVDDRTRELAAANRELEAFAYRVSHDLRAHLRGVNFIAKALVEDFASNLPPDAHEYTARLRGETDRMTRLVNDLLLLSKATRVHIHREDVNLTNMARSALEELQRRDPSRDVETRIAGGLHTLSDSGLTRVILENLLGNAWKYTSKTSRARIEVGAERSPGGDTVFFVRDNGAGFDPATADRMFEAFERLHPAVEFEGMGIGLATVKRIVERHGGRAWAESAGPGTGAAFYFTL